ncbi:MAG TPA: tetratricopeptide repeat protein, partial [Ktedonobacterales bacterium]|nr:tetratricopeptide repeat protein [Ktedonobacterales bacterium]
PHDAEILNLLGASLRELGDDAGAERAFHQALALDPDRATTLTLLGIQASLQRRFDEASAWADSALAVDPGFYDAYVSRGFARLFLEDTAGARADAAVASQLPSGSHVSDQTLAVLLEAHEHQVPAARNRVARILRAVDLRRPSPFEGSLVAGALVAIGDSQRALDVLERVQPRGAALWFWLRFPQFDAVRSQRRFLHVLAEAQPATVSRR